MLKKEDALFLKHLTKSLNEAMSKLEEAYKNKDADNFNKAKKLMLKIQKQISDILK